MRVVDSKHLGGTIGVISGDLARFPAFYVSLIGLVVPPETHWQWVRGNGFAVNRNLVVENFKGDWLWFLDDDHVFDYDLLMKLLDRNVDIVQPLISTRKPPYYPYAYNYDAEKREFIGLDWDHLPADGLFGCDAVGTGCTLIRKHVFDAVGYPWFEEGKTARDAPGEDLWFCIKARELGFKCFVDTDNRVGHITTAEVWPAKNDDKRVIDLNMDHGLTVRLRSTAGRTNT